MRIRSSQGEYEGLVRHCRYQPTCGYFVGVEFSPRSRWSQQQYCPPHLLDPLSLRRASPRRRRGAAPVPAASEALALNDALHAGESAGDAPLAGDFGE